MPTLAQPRIFPMNRYFVDFLKSQSCTECYAELGFITPRDQIMITI